MTLIVACITPEYIAQVSDRRLTNLRTGRPADDNRNKAVLLGSNAVVGFTGLADIENMPADEWIVEVLGESLDRDGDRYKALESLRDRATSAFRRIPLSPAFKRHAFQVVGWGRFPGEEAIEPFLYLISNFAGDDAWLTRARDVFDLRRLRPGTNALALFPVGQPIDLLPIRRTAVSALERGTGPAAIARALVEGVRRVAATNTAVGMATLVSVLPKPDPEGPTRFVVNARMPPLAPSSRLDYFTDAISVREPSFVYVPAAIDATPVAYGPAIVGPMRMKGIEFGAQPPDGTEER